MLRVYVHAETLCNLVTRGTAKRVSLESRGLVRKFRLEIV
jgi:hypothetical protein